MHKASRGMGVGVGLKAIWKRNSRKKTAVKVSESDDWVDVGGATEHSPARELPRKMSLKRKNSMASEKVSPQLHNYTTYNVPYCNHNLQSLCCSNA